MTARRSASGVVLGAVGVLAVALVVVVPAPGRAEATAGRLAGETRFGTAVAISRAAFRSGADTVYLARAFDPLVDALAGGTLRDGPVLLVPGCGPLPGEVVAEIGRLDPDRVVALGGPTAICRRQLRAAAAAAPDGVADRLAGSSRFGTAVAISRAAFPDGSDAVYLARGTDPLTDGLAGGSLRDGPVLLVPGCGPVPAEVMAEIARLDATRVIALGGPVAICDDLVLAAATGSRGAYRIAGENRFGTAVAISRVTFPTGSDVVYLARASAPLVDALAGGVLRRGPILLVPGSGRIPPAVLAEIQRLAPDRVMALGGPAAISDGVLDAAAASVTPDAGPSPSPSPTEPPTPGQVEILGVTANPDGSDVAVDGGESIDVRNIGGAGVSMDGWYVLDDDGNRLSWCDITLAPGATARLYTGPGDGGDSHCHAGRTEAVLDDDGDTLELHRPDDSVADVHTYG